MSRPEPSFEALPTIAQTDTLGDWIDVQVEDRIDQLAREFLGDSRLWRYIAAANPQITDTRVLPVGGRIFIPSLQTISALLEQT